MRYLYSLLMYMVTPLIVLRLLTRGIRYGGFHQRWPERFGTFSDPGFSDSLWIHAVSMGEVNAAEPLINALRKRYPASTVVVTTVTPTGSERVRQLFGDSVFHVYLPYDLPFAVRRFLSRIRPRLAVIVETEIWPNLYFTCRRRGIPLMIVNARLSERSMRGYRAMRGVVRAALRCVQAIAAQSDSDAARYLELGADPASITVSGNLKFDMPVPKDAVEAGQGMRERWGRMRPVWIAASTHEGEEMPVLEAHLAVLQRLPDALLLLAPRHPERFRQVEQTVRELGFSAGTRSTDRVPAPAHQVFVIDAMGELMPFFAASDLAFVGGSLAPIGGHNVLEPAALSKPVLVGRHTFNFEQITLALLSGDGGQRVQHSDQLGPQVLQLLRDPVNCAAMGRRARTVFESERGAVEQVMALIEALLQHQPIAD